MDRILLAVDLSYQSYRAAAAHPMLTCRDVFTGGLYGFLMTFGKMVRETRATDVVFCQDVKPYLRSLSYPEYKQIRKKSVDEELGKRHQQSMKLILEVLTSLGFIPWGIKGFESDDLIAHCVMKYRHRFAQIYAGSNDSDLFQLFWAPNFFVYGSDVHSAMSASNLHRKVGLDPAQFMLASALQGTHNDIAGIAGVGEVTARKIVLDPVKLRATMSSHGEMVTRNLGLIKLPHPEFPRISSLPARPKGFDTRAFVRTLGKYEVDATASMVSAFEQLTN